MTKSLYPSLGNFNPASPPIIEVRPSAEEVRAAYQRIDELEADLTQAQEALEALGRIAIVCTDNMDRNCDHRMALDFVRQIANEAIERIL